MHSQTLALLCVCFLEIINSGLNVCCSNGTFYYYAYGSNLLTKRLHIRNPSAIFYSTAKLKNHRLDFNMYVAAWNGAVSTIVEDDEAEVWGDLWVLDLDQQHYLDEQEGVALGWYFPKNVTVTTPNGEEILARTYEESVLPAKLRKGEDLPQDRRPSNTYLEWADEKSLFPTENGAAGQILQAMRTSQIVLVDNAPKGTQLKLLLLLEGKQKLYFKPKRYKISDVIRGSIYAGYDRHNSEVFTYYLAMILNYKWVAPSVIRRVHFNQDILAHATVGLKRTMVKNDKESVCIYGKCYYCKANETVCPDSKGEIEGAAILYLDKQFKVHKSPWRRSYNNLKMEWENDNEFCKKVTLILSTKRILNLIDIAIIDFLIQNGDRHRYEVYKNKIILLDNGKGLGNPMVDELDILAPLYQCCILSTSTWRSLELASGGSITETIKILAAFQGENLTTDDHYRAIERRLLKVYAVVQYCIERHGSAKVFKNIDGI